MSFVGISFYVLSLLFGPCRLSEFTLSGPLNSRQVCILSPVSAFKAPYPYSYTINLLKHFFQAGHFCWREKERQEHFRVQSRKNNAFFFMFAGLMSSPDNFHVFCKLMYQIGHFVKRTSLPFRDFQFLCS